MATWRTRYASSASLDLVVTATESDVNIENNTSKVTVVVQLKSSSSTTAWNGYPQGLSVTIDGASAGSRSFTYSVPAGGTVSLGTYSRVVTHNSDGTKSARIQVSASGGGDSGSIDQNLGLTTIARASIPTVSKTSVPLGDSVTINFNRKSPNFRHTLTYSFAGTSGTLVSTGSNVASHAWTLPASLANSIPSKTSNGLTFTLTTYNGSTNIGSKTISITVTVPNNSTYNPTITQPTWAETVSAVSSNFAGMIIDGRSKVKFTSTASTKYGATVSNIQIRFTKSTGGSWTFNADVSGTTATYLWNANDSKASWSIQMIVTDSRGRTATSTALNIGVTAYSAPRIIKANADRSASVATNLVLNLSATGSGLVSKNLMTLNIFVKPKTSTLWGTAKYTVGVTNGTITLTNHSLSGYAETSAFDVKFQLYDKLTPAGAVDSIITIGTTKILFGAYKDVGVAIGRMYDVAQGGSLQVGGLATFDGDIKQTGNAQDVRFILEPKTGNASIELGSLGSASTPYIDFHSSGSTNDRDARIIAEGGTAGSVGQGTLRLESSKTIVSNTLLVGGDDTRGLGIVGQSKNANGTYIRFSTGVQICWHEMRTSTGASYATGNMFRTNSTLWTFPASFVGTPITSANPIGVAGETWAGMGAGGVSTTTASFMVWSSWARGSETINVGLMAIGYWR